MATSLAAQLNQIAAKSSKPLDLKAQKKAHAQSFIFEQTVATSQDFDTLYQLCVEGFQELCQLDARFIIFSRSIFSEQSKHEDRGQLTAAQNQELDRSLESFLSLVGRRLLLKPAIKAVEWLIRRFRVHEHNTIWLILTFLPYHTTPMFATLLSILPRPLPLVLKFLYPYVESLKNPPRHAIIYTATRNEEFFSALNSYVLKACRNGHQYQAMVSYWATIVTEAVIGILDLAKAGNQVIRRQNEEDILLRVLPVLNEGLAMRKVPDLRVGCYMVLTVLASQMNLDDAVLIAMMEAVASNWTLDTTNAGLICLSVLAQQRENVKLPKKVFKAIMSIESLETDILALNARYQVGNLTLGLILGILKGLGGDHDTYNLKFVRTAIENGLMDDTLVSTAVKSILATADTSNPSRFYGLDVQGELADLILRLADSETVRVNVQNVIANATIDMRQLEMKLRTVLSPVIGPEQLAIQDTAMGDAIREARIETFETAVDLIPTRTAYETSFLSHSESYVFGSLSHAFQLASDSPSTLKRFMELPVLRKSLGSTEPLFLTFFVRIWCGQYSNSVRAAAIACITIYLKDGPVTRDLQFLLPYIIYGLGDASAIVRQTTTDLALALSSTYTRGNSNDGKEHNREVLGKEQIYGQGEPTNSISWLSTGQVIGFIDQVLILNLEELRLDPSYISRLVAGHLNGPRANGPKLAKKDLKTSLRIDLLWFLSTHVSGTPLYSVKIRLLSLLNGVEKVGSISRTDTLLPVLISHENIDGKILQTACQNEKLEEASVYSHLVAVVLPRNEKGIDVLRRIISRERSSSPPLLMKAALHRIRHIWGSVKPDQQLLLASTCLDLIFNNSVQDSYLEQEEDALETLQTVTLSAAILLAFLESVPSLSDRASVQSASKRRRTLQGPVGREPAHLDKELQENLRKITVILELVDGSEAGTNPHLLADLFGVLADIHHLRSQLGTQMAYVQSLALGCLNRIVEAAAADAGTKIDHSALRADLVIESFKASTSKQVKHAALSLISSLVIVAPEVIIHGIMPVFIFMEKDTLRESDEYSAHVVDQMISSVIPPLVVSLHKQKEGLLPASSKLLHSFVAAYEHMPGHRRNHIFSSFVDKLGPDDFLFAVLAMLVDKYGSNKDVADFAAGLASRYNAITQLGAMEKYLDVILDCLTPKKILSDPLLNFDSRSRQAIALNLLTLPAKILGGRQLATRLAKVLGRQKEGKEEFRRIHSRMIEQVLTLAKDNHGFPKIPIACGHTLDALLGMVTMQECIASVEILLGQKSNDIRRQVLKSLELRIDGAKPGDLSTPAACLGFLPRLIAVLEENSDIILKHTALGCIDRITEKYGKTDVPRIVSVLRKIIGEHCLQSANMELRVMALLHLATSAEVIGEAIIPVLPVAVLKAIEYLKDSIKNGAEGERLHNAVYTFFASLLLQIPFMMTGEYLDHLLEASYESASSNLSAECEGSRIETLQMIPKHVDPVECFAALERTWDTALVEGAEAVDEHLEILSMAIDAQPKSTVARQSPLLLAIFLNVFDVRRSQPCPRTEESYDDEDVDRIEEKANRVLVKMIYKLNDRTFRPLFARISEWANVATTEEERQGQVFRQTTWYTFLHTFFDALKSIVTSYASFLVDTSAAILSESTATNPGQLLVDRVLATLHSAFSHDQDEFWQSPTHFAPISGPLLALLATTPTPARLVPALTALATAADAPANQQVLNTGILAHMRSEAAGVRAAAVRCQRSLTAAMGEEWLARLPEMLPLISEGMEDEDEEVEAEVRGWVVEIEGILGESLDGMLA